MAQSAPQAVGERLLALVTLQPSSQRIVRRAWRSAQRLGADLDVLTCSRRRATRRPRSASSSRRCAVSRRCSACTLVEEPGEDLAEVVERVARERGTTYVLMGTPQSRSGLRRFSEPLVDRLLRRLPGIDVRIVADRSKRRVSR